MIDLYGRRVLLMHGDTLCIDDHAYQRLRRIVRNPLVQFVLRRLSAAAAAERSLSECAPAARRTSTSMDSAAPDIMDVNAGRSPAHASRATASTASIHGHTHRPAIHEMQIDGHQRYAHRARRLVRARQRAAMEMSSGFELARR